MRDFQKDLDYQNVCVFFRIKCLEKGIFLALLEKKVYRTRQHTETKTANGKRIKTPKLRRRIFFIIKASD